MSKIISLLALSIFSLSAFAFSTQSSQSAIDEIVVQGKVHNCMMSAWKDTKPSDDQNVQAQKFIDAGKAIIAMHADAIKAEVANLKAAYAAYPIVRDDVITAENALQVDVVPAKAAFRDAAINILNLLSADQRKLYDESFKTCIEKKD